MVQQKSPEAQYQQSQLLVLGYCLVYVVCEKQKGVKSHSLEWDRVQCEFKPLTPKIQSVHLVLIQRNVTLCPSTVYHRVALFTPSSVFYSNYLNPCWDWSTEYFMLITKHNLRHSGFHLKIASLIVVLSVAAAAKPKQQ